MVAVVGVVSIASLAAWSLLRNPFPELALKGAKHVYEPTGFDGIHCWKLAVGETTALKKIEELGLENMDSYPSYDASPANCHVAWWDIVFPLEAQSYSLSNEGSIRRLAAYKNGTLYVTHENR